MATTQNEQLKFRDAYNRGVAMVLSEMQSSLPVSVVDLLRERGRVLAKQQWPVQVFVPKEITSWAYGKPWLYRVNAGVLEVRPKPGNVLFNEHSDHWTPCQIIVPKQVQELAALMSDPNEVRYE